MTAATIIVLILIGIFCIPFMLANLDRKWDWRTPEAWRDLILGLIATALFVWLFL